jgi:MFS family permease
MSLAPSLAVLFLGAVMFGMATAAVLALSMTILQTQLSQGDRVAAFTVLHLVIRGGLVAAAIGAGAAADLVGAVDWPVVGVLPPVRVVLLSSGLVVLATAVTFGRIRVFARLSHGLAGRR